MTDQQHKLLARLEALERKDHQEQQQFERLMEQLANLRSLVLNSTARLGPPNSTSSPGNGPSSPTSAPGTKRQTSGSLYGSQFASSSVFPLGVASFFSSRQDASVPAPLSPSGSSAGPMPRKGTFQSGSAAHGHDAGASSNQNTLHGIARSSSWSAPKPSTSAAGLSAASSLSRLDEEAGRATGAAVLSTPAPSKQPSSKSTASSTLAVTSMASAANNGTAAELLRSLTASPVVSARGSPVNFLFQDGETDGDGAERSANLITPDEFDSLMHRLRDSDSPKTREDVVQVAANNYMFTCRQVGLVLRMLRYAAEKESAARALGGRISDFENQLDVLLPMLQTEQAPDRHRIIVALGLRR